MKFRVTAIGTGLVGAVADHTFVIDDTGSGNFVAVRGLDGKWKRTSVTDAGLQDYHLVLDYAEVAYSFFARFLISAYTASVFSRKDHTLTVGRNL